MTEDERVRIGRLSVEGLSLDRTGEYEQALVKFRASLAITPSYCDHYNAGNMLLALQRPSEALEEFDRSILCKDDYAQAHCNRAIALTQLARQSEARGAFERAIAVDPQLTNAHRCYAILLKMMGDLAAEVVARYRLAELDAGNSRGWLDLADALKRARGKNDRFVDSRPGGAEDQILDAIERALMVGVGDPQLRRWAWAEKLLRLGRVTAASGRWAAQYRQAAEHAVELFPQDKWFADQLEHAREF